MSGKWYYLKGGLPQGPYLKSEIEAMILDGSLHAMDFVHKGSEEKWRPLGEVKVFKKYFADKQPQNSLEEEWVLLIGQDDGFLQKGPFKLSEVKQLIQKGELKYSDFIWKEGMSEWTLVSEMFGRREQDKNPEESREAPAGEEASEEELLKNVTTLGELEEAQRQSAVMPEVKPAEADGEELVEEFLGSFRAEPKPKKTKKQAPEKTEKKTKPKDQVVKKEVKQKRIKSKVCWMRLQFFK